MIINKCKLQIIGAYIFVSAIFSYNAKCQSCPIIDIDKVAATKLPEKQKEDPIPDGMLRFNDIIKIKAKSLTPYTVDHIPAYQSPIISNGTVFLDLDNRKSVYGLESTNEISNTNKTSYYQYSLTEYSEKIYTKNETYKSMFGTYPSKTEYYLVSIEQPTGDTLWKKQADYVSVHSAKKVSLIGNYIVDNKTGKELFKLNSSKPISFSEVKEDDGYLYLSTTISTTERELFAINLLEGEVIWRVKGNFNSFFIDETRIYTSNQCAIDKQTGKLIWGNSSDIWIVGQAGNYLIGYLFYGEDDPELFAYNKDTGKLAGYLWSDEGFCTSCLGYGHCNPEFIFSEQAEGNKTAAIIKCSDGVYLYTFEAEADQY